MGTDIHMYIVDKNGNYVRNKSIFDGRNSEWFDNLQGNSWNNCYDNFPKHSGIPENSPAELEKTYKESRENYYYGFFHIKVIDYIEWFRKMRPHIDAGWLSTYEKWQYEAKGIVPEDISHYLDKECNPNDYHFIEIENPYDPSKWLYDYLEENKIEFDNYICYYFDC